MSNNSTVKALEKAYRSYDICLCCTYRRILLYPVDVNNYEISKWEYEYLTIWMNTHEHPYITSEKLFAYLKLNYTDIFQLYFMIYDGNVTIDTFIQFICLFALCKVDEQVRVLLSVCGFQSNVNLSYQQTCTFIKCLERSAYIDPEVAFFLKQNENKQVSISSLIELISSSSILSKPFIDLQVSLIDNFIGLKSFTNIITRVRYYNHDYNNKEGVNIAKNHNESCCNKIIRTFLGRPPPYYTDYPAVTADKNCNFENVIALIRARYGYSRRLTYSNLPSIRSPSGRSQSVSRKQEYEDGRKRISNHLSNRSSRRHESTTKSFCQSHSSLMKLLSPVNSGTGQALKSRR